MIQYARERYLADFRTGLTRIRFNADQIATLHAERTEQLTLESTFEKIKRAVWERMKVDKAMRLVQFILGQGSDLFPLIFLAHAYFTGAVGLGHFVRIRMAVGNIQGSMSWFMDSYTSIAKFRACSNRLVEMLEHCEKVSSVRLLSPQFDADAADGSLRLTSAKGRLPTGTLLWSVEDLVIKEGEWTLIQGSEGSGKTTLIRLIAGAWPVQEGTELRLGTSGQKSPSSKEEYNEGEEEKEEKEQNSGKPNVDGCLPCHDKYIDGTGNDGNPEWYDVKVKTVRDEFLCVPTGAYRLRSGLCLKKAVCYPDDADEFCDEEVAKALESVGLKKLLEVSSARREPETPEDGSGLNASAAEDGPDPEPIKEWPALHCDHGDRMLSNGESQRLELAHVLLTKPRWCFIDEPVSHVAEEEKEPLFTKIRAELKGSTTMVTITHDVSALTQIHDSALELRDGQLRKIRAAA